MRRRTRQQPEPDPTAVEAALRAMGAAELRDLVGDLLLELDDLAYNRAVSGIIDRAAHGASGWSPPGPSGDAVGRIVAFADAARLEGYAEPSDVEDCLRDGSNAFLGRDYEAAVAIFAALLPFIGSGEIHLGQHEMVDEVLGIDAANCAVRYAVAVYMTADPAGRAAAVGSAIDDMDGLGGFYEPLREMERAAVEPLPGFDAFLPRWRALLEKRYRRRPDSDRDIDDETGRWLREVVYRLEGVDGLARLARSTGRASDLRAWCNVPVAAGSWKAALAAYREAAEIVSGRAYSHGEFLDGAALCAQELGRRDLPAFLERAWRAAPEMSRLRRWLGSAASGTVLRRRAAEALDVCPKNATRQRALLHLLAGDFESPATLLAAAPALGWSAGEHPGHIVFPVFHHLLSGGELRLGEDAERPPFDPSGFGEAIEAFGWMADPSSRPRLATPRTREILELAAVREPADAGVRGAMLRAMQSAAEKRVAAITENKRRRHYGHVAYLVTACADADPSPRTLAWMAGIRTTYRRFRALQSEFDRLSRRA